MAIFVTLATNGIVIFKGKTQGINLRMTTSAAFKLLMFENGFTDGRGSSDASEEPRPSVKPFSNINNLKAALVVIRRLIPWVLPLNITIPLVASVTNIAM